MASVVEHIEQAVRNENLAAVVEEHGDRDWAVVMLFYAALSLVQAFFVQNGIIVRYHSQRDAEIEKSPDLNLVAASYRALKLHSENARYDCYRFSHEELEEIKTNLYQPLATHVLGLLRTTP
jgi:HEPN domain-containing protein